MAQRHGPQGPPTAATRACARFAEARGPGRATAAGGAAATVAANAGLGKGKGLGGTSYLSSAVRRGHCAVLDTLCSAGAAAALTMEDVHDAAARAQAPEHTSCARAGGGGI